MNWSKSKKYWLEKTGFLGGFEAAGLSVSALVVVAVAAGGGSADSGDFTALMMEKNIPLQLSPPRLPPRGSGQVLVIVVNGVCGFVYGNEVKVEEYAIAILLSYNTFYFVYICMCR